MTRFLIVLLLMYVCSLNFIFANEDIPSPCVKEEETKNERLMELCLAKKQPSEKIWLDLDIAKKDVLLAFKTKNISKLIPYIGCDANDNTQHEFLCSEPPNKIHGTHLEAILNKIIKAKDSLNDVKWFNYGVKKDIYILCTKNTKTTRFQNHCLDKSYQPLVDIRKTTKGYYFFGVAMNFPDDQ